MDALTLSSDDRELIRSLIIAEPGLVLEDDTVIQRLVGESRGDRQVVDLRDRLVERLEQRLDRLTTTHRTVIAAAYENVAGTRQVHHAIVSLLEPADLTSFLQRLTMEVPILLGLSDARLCLETDTTTAGPAEGFAGDLRGRVIALPQGAVASYLELDGASSRLVVLRPAGEEAEMLFGEANPVQSEALLRLDIAGGAGMLAFGSSDPKKFDPNDGTELLEFFAQVIERLLVQRLADPDT